ncbi:MAG: hypothetical protein WBB70_02070 [Desulfobacterales bacterium]
MTTVVIMSAMTTVGTILVITNITIIKVIDITIKAIMGLGTDGIATEDNIQMWLDMVVIIVKVDI